MASRLICEGGIPGGRSGGQFTLGRYAEYLANVSARSGLVHPYAGVLGRFFTERCCVRRPCGRFNAASKLFPGKYSNVSRRVAHRREEVPASSVPVGISGNPTLIIENKDCASHAARSPQPVRMGDPRGCRGRGRATIITCRFVWIGGRCWWRRATRTPLAGAAERDWSIDYVTTDYERICADPAIDAVIIATPNFTHVPIAMAAASRAST